MIPVIKNKMSNNSLNLPEEPTKQWEILLLLISSEEKKIDRTNESEVDTINYFYKNDGVKKILLQWLHEMHTTYAKKSSELDTALKSDDVSLYWRQRGNDKFRANLVEASYECYSKSTVYAKPNGPMYPLALANRSAALLRLKKYEECLLDIELALTHFYPREQQHKLLLRRADCHIELGQQTKARAALAAAMVHAQSLNLSSSHIVEFDKHIKLLEHKLEVNVNKGMECNVLELPECHLGENPDFNAASNAIEIRHSETAGRYVATKEMVHRGDVLFSEEPYAWVSLPADDPVCERCCQPNINVVPCTECSRSVYCCESCRDQAAEIFHRWECVGAQSDVFPTIGIAHLALRVLLISAYNDFPLGLCPQAKPVTAVDLFRCYDDVDKIHIYKKNIPPFYRMFNLVTNFDKMNNTDYIQYALTATMLTLYLEHFTSFFEYLPSKVPYALSDSQLRLFAGALMLRALGQLVCNGHATLSLVVVDDEDSNGQTVTEREVRRATAIYPSAAMMNHSCDPNIINTFYKSRLIIRCGGDLSRGSEVLNCYGPHRAREPAPHRRARLRAQYMFHCACAACADSERRDFVSLFSAYACSSCKGPVVCGASRPQCQQCRAEFQLDRALALIDRADEMLVQADTVTSLEKKCEKTNAAYRLKQQVWHRYHTSLRSTADRLARLYADVGEYSKSVELIKQNIQSLEYQFGSFSVEVAHELRKLSDVMLERILNTPQHPDYKEWCMEAHKIIKKAVQLMGLNYGAWEPLVKRLKEQEAYVASLLADRTPDAADVHHNLHYNLKI